MKEEGNLFLIVLNYYIIIFKQQALGESYIVSPYWIASKKATIDPKNERDNECCKNY